MGDSARRADLLLSAWQRWVRARPVLYRLTLGTRVLLAVGFIPTGAVNLLGRRFTSMSPESDIGGLFVPHSWGRWLVPGCLLSLLVALWRGLFHRK